MTVSLKEARDAIFVLQRFLDQLAQQEPITQKQVKYIQDLCKRKGKPEPANLNTMSKEEASRLIDELKGRS